MSQFVEPDFFRERLALGEAIQGLRARLFEHKKLLDWALLTGDAQRAEVAEGILACTRSALMRIEIMEAATWQM